MARKFSESLPRFYVVDFEIFVKVEKIGDNIVATNHLGNPYPVYKAMESGKEVTEAQYTGAVGAALKKRKA